MLNSMARNGFRPASLDDEKHLLTTRERQIIQVAAQGASNKQIAQQLKLAEGTVKVHLHRIYGKLGIANRTALIVLAHTGLARPRH